METKHRAHGKLLNIYHQQKGKCFWCSKPLSLQKDADNFLRIQIVKMDGKRTEVGLCPICKVKFEAKGILAADRACLMKQMNELAKRFTETLKQLSIILYLLARRMKEVIKGLNELMNSSFGPLKTILDEYPAIANEKTGNQ